MSNLKGRKSKTNYLSQILVIALMLFVLVVIAFPDAFRNRVDTWKNRIENFTSDKPGEDDYQIKNAKIDGGNVLAL